MICLLALQPEDDKKDEKKEEKKDEKKEDSPKKKKTVKMVDLPIISQVPQLAQDQLLVLIEKEVCC